MERTEEILEIVREIREDIAHMKRHRNMLCGMPILEVELEYRQKKMLRKEIRNL